MINNFKLYVTDRSGVSNYHDRNITHMISIGDPGQKKPYINHFAVRPNILRLEFDDVILGDSAHLAATEKDIEKIINFAKSIKIDLNNWRLINCLVHCFAGIARSTAAAYIVLNVLTGPGKEVETFNYLLECRPCAIPNTLMVDLADKLLDRNGKMASLTRTYRNNYLKNIAWTS